MALDGIDTKSLLSSRGVWGGIIAVLAGLLGLLGYDVDADMKGQAVELFSGVGAGIGGVIAIVGRVLATKKIG